MIVNFGKRVSQARHESGFTQNQLALALNKSTQAVKLVERGTSLMTLETFMKLCEITKKSPDFFLQEDCRQAKIENILSLMEDINRFDNSQLALLGDMFRNINRKIKIKSQ